MNPIEKSTAFEEIMEEVIDNGTDGILPAMKLLFDFAMRQERVEFLKAAPYERSESRLGYANGYKPKTIHTRMGPMTVEIPQVRGLQFYPKSLEKGCRSERALKLAIAEMYVKGVSTRKVTKITEQLCGFNISSGQVSRLSQAMDKELDAFRNRPLGSFSYVHLDARYEKARYGGIVRDLAVFVAVGIQPGKPRELIGISASLSEAEVHWNAFLRSLKDRGLKDVKLITGDDHGGLKEARKDVFGSVPYQRCQFHLQQNGQSYVPRRNLKKPLASILRSIFNSPNKEIAMMLVKDAVKTYGDVAPEWTAWLEDNIEEGLTVFAFPEEHRRRIRTTNGLERLNREIKRRTRVASLFPNPESCLRLVTAIVQEIHEEWCTGKIYLSIPENENNLNENPVNPFYRKKVA